VTMELLIKAAKGRAEADPHLAHEAWRGAGRGFGMPPRLRP